MTLETPLPIRKLASESLASVWARRCVSIPLVLSAFSLGLATVMFWLPFLILWDAYSGKGRLPKSRASLFMLYYLFSEIWGLLLAAFLWFFTAGGALGGNLLYVRANFKLQGIWTRALFFGTRKLFGVKVEAEGLEHACPSPFILMVRHASLADTVLASTFIGHPTGTGLRYILKKELLWDPCLDVVGRRLPNHFIDRSGSRRDEELRAVRDLTRSLDRGEGVLIYPEGTRFSVRKLKTGLEKLKSTGKDNLYSLACRFRHVLPPRTGGSLAILEEAPNTDVLILAHTGLESAARWSDFWSGGLVDRTLFIRLTRIKSSNIPDGEREEWLYRLWADVDDWIQDRKESAGELGALAK